MAQSLDEQVAVVERALGECMVDTALVVVRSWLNEIGENNPYEEAYATLQKDYRALFAKWLNVEDPQMETELERLTGDAYQLVDAVYADIRLKRGLSPDMHGFNHDSLSSVSVYFESCVRLRPEDLEWLHEAMNDETRSEMALVAVNALAMNLRKCFSIDAFLALIEGMNAENEIAAGMCTMHVMMLLVQYDVRIDFFPQIQDAFVAAITQNDSSDRVFELLCALVRNEQILKVVPAVDDARYLAEIIPLIPNTWLYALLIEGSTEREQKFAYYSILAGNRDLMWDFPDVAERIYVGALRGGKNQPMDYINYAHCLLMRGDRMLAFENYLQARQLCGSSKEFFALFRPDRKQLVDHGIPVEHIYMIEDQLLEGHA